MSSKPGGVKRNSGRSPTTQPRAPLGKVCRILVAKSDGMEEVVGCELPLGEERSLEGTKLTQKGHKTPRLTRFTRA